MGVNPGLGEPEHVTENRQPMDAKPEGKLGGVVGSGKERPQQRNDSDARLRSRHLARNGPVCGSRVPTPHLAFAPWFGTTIRVSYVDFEKQLLSSSAGFPEWRRDGPTRFVNWRVRRPTILKSHHRIARVPSGGIHLEFRAQRAWPVESDIASYSPADRDWLQRGDCGRTQ
jgi:hypothetical protein